MTATHTTDAPRETAIGVSSVFKVFGRRPKDVVQSLKQGKTRVLPPEITRIAAEVKDALKPDAVVVSVAAGVSTERIEASLRGGQPAIRTMPNTPLAVGLGVVGLTPGSHVSDSQVQGVIALFEPSGSVHVVHEEQMDELNAMTGSGPGYLYYLAEHMTAAGIALGFAPELAGALTAQTLLGASTILARAQKTDSDAAAVLRAGMWLPGGTTARAYDVFDDHGMAEAIVAGIRGSAARSTEIAREVSEG